MSDKGRVYTWGLNLLGQLGQRDNNPRDFPTLVRDLDSPIKLIASGAGHCMAVDNSNNLYSWGASADFQTGIFVKPQGKAGEDTK